MSLDRGGFTLIEMLIVIALVAMIFGVALPRVANVLSLNLKSSTRKLAATIKETYNSTVVTGNVHRIAYDLEKNEYWVEVGPADSLLHTEESKKAEEERKRWTSQRDEAKEEPSSFSLDPTITRKKVSLPEGVEFEDVMTQYSSEAFTSEVAYTHFFPHGVTEQTLIHLKDTDDHKVSLVISALIGRTRLINGYVTKEDIFGN